ncbi:RodZ family helix-turn-helix domain-containing protein, partial [Caulobacter sp. 17J80-11]|uniref:helix-turn-helix domain-containing protein n=1 Tax=Caulobacter sp. 17J80-11 TaxID=2763502 RepID=UPI0016539506
MTPLDSGSVTETYHSPAWDSFEPVSLTEAASLGEGLKQAREASGRSLQQLAEATRVRREYLSALEQGAYDQLPSRPFVVGYVRSYAKALGLDEETAADLYKKESPDYTTPLQAPVGSELDDVKKRSPALFAVAGVVICAVVAWNVVQRAVNAQHASPSALSDTPEGWSLGAVPGGRMTIGAPRPAPADQTVPVAYVTPGLENELAEAGADAAAQAAALTAAPTVPVRAAFNPKGAVYGVAPQSSSVILQARKAATLVVSGADGTIYFARQLAAGEAYRAPRGLAASVDVSDPLVFDVFLNGESYGTLETLKTALSSLNGKASDLAAQSAARAQAEAEAAARAQAAQA